MFNRKPKMRVDVLTEAGLKPKKYVLEGNRVLIQKARGVKGDPSIYAEFDKDCIVPYTAGVWPFRRLKQKLVWVEGHKKCVSFYGKNVSLSYFDAKGFFDRGALKNAGATNQMVKIPGTLYIVFAIIIFIGILDLLLSSGKVRIV